MEAASLSFLFMQKLKLLRCVYILQLAIIDLQYSKRTLVSADHRRTAPIALQFH